MPPAGLLLRASALDALLAAAAAQAPPAPAPVVLAPAVAPVALGAAPVVPVIPVQAGAPAAPAAPAAPVPAPAPATVPPLAALTAPAPASALAAGAPAGAPAPAPAAPEAVVPPGSAPVAAAAAAPPPPPPCPPLKREYESLFMLTRLVNLYTELRTVLPTAPLNASLGPVTVLGPREGARVLPGATGLDLRGLAAHPLQAILLAPTLGAQFVLGYFPAMALPFAPVDNLCGVVCGRSVFAAEQPVRVSLERNASALTTITKLNAFDCPGRYVVHKADAFLYTQVADPVQAAQPALNLEWALGGEWDSFRLVPRA